ncbi:MAG: hypothetical protein LAT67_06640 [Balneolales bacterium]|nr:hypothetical protein [Balneolales bacterium]
MISRSRKYRHDVLKRIFVFTILAFCACPAVLTAQDMIQELPAVTDSDPDFIFSEANFLFEQRRYTEALSRFQSLEEMGYSSPELWLNIGLSHLRLDNLALADYYFNRAYLHAVASHNTAIAGKAYRSAAFTSERLALQFSLPPELAVYRLHNSIVYEFGWVNAFLFALVFLNLGAVALVLSWFRADLMRLLQNAAAVFAVAFVVFLLLGLWSRSEANEWARGQIVQTGFEMRASAGTESEAVFSPFPPFRLRIQRNNETITTPETKLMVYITLSNGISGWIDAEAVRRFD